jgi:glucose-6-phosphate dehydrogenase assembly protein OpcA
MRDLQTYLSAHGVKCMRTDLIDVDPDELRAAAVDVLTRDTRTREYAASLAGTSPAKPGQ